MILYAFDLDGVLIDSLPNMRVSWVTVQNHHNIDIPFSEYQKHIGKPFRDIMKTLGVTQDVKKTYDEASLKNKNLIRIYDDAISTIEKLKAKGHKVAVCTSKTVERTNVILKDFPEFDVVCCPKQGLRGKPAPDQLLYTMAMCNVDPKQTIYIGDMDTDRQCAERAGTEFYHANYGYGKCEVSVKSIHNLTSLLG